MLSISDFSEICYLSPQTLRFYHSEGLLVPANVDEQTGYRSYTFEQVEQAMLIAVLRSAGMSVKLVRQALDQPDAALDLLQQHRTELERQRQAQDEAIRDARELLTSWPAPRLIRAPKATVASKPVPGPSVVRDQYDWNEADASLTVTVQELVQTVESAGAVVAGTPWRTWEADTPEQQRQTVTAEGPHWLVKIPITASPEAARALSGTVEVQTFEARDELSVLIPGKSSTAKFGTALSRLLTHPLDAAFIDLSRVRQLLHDDGVETTVAVCSLNEDEAEADAEAEAE